MLPILLQLMDIYTVTSYKIVFLRGIWEDWLKNDCQPNYWKPGVRHYDYSTWPGPRFTPSPSSTGEWTWDQADKSVKLRSHV